MTYKELKDHIRDLGFEEDEGMEEYKRIFNNAVNRAVSIIMRTVVSRMESYFKFEDSEWTMPIIEKVNEDTQDGFVLCVPDKLSDLLQLLTAHYVWLDDDERKAILYWNEYESLRELLLAECTGGTKSRIVGGFYV